MTTQACGCLDVFAVRPGYEGANRPVPDIVWCKPCWLLAFTRAVT